MLEKYVTTFDELQGGNSKLTLSLRIFFSFFNLGIQVICALKKSDFEVLKVKRAFPLLRQLDLLRKSAKCKRTTTETIQSTHLCRYTPDLHTKLHRC